MATDSLVRTSYVLGAVTAVGGTAGFIKSGSLPSMIAGCTVGALYTLGGYRIQKGAPYGVELSLLASVVLGASSIPRAIRLRGPVPIVLGALSLYGLVIFGGAFRKSL